MATFVRSKVTRPSEQALRAERQHQRHQREREDDGVLLAAVVARDRKVRHGEREDEPVEHGPDRRARQRAHAADDHDDERVEKPLAVLTLRDGRLRAADDGTERGECRADDERDREGPLDVDPDRRGHLPVVDARADHHPGPRLLQPEPEDDADGDPEREDDEPRERVVDAPDVEVDEAIRPARPGDGHGVAAVLLRSKGHRARKVRDDLVGDDDGYGDRDERLAKVLALVPAQQELLDTEPEHGDARHRDEPRHHPLERVHLLPGQEEPGARHPLLYLVRDVAAEEVERAVGHVDDAHEPEDEREPARDDEQEPGERETVEDGLEERARIVQRGSRVGRPPVAPQLPAADSRSRGRTGTRTRRRRPRRRAPRSRRLPTRGFARPPAGRTYQRRESAFNAEQSA